MAQPVCKRRCHVCRLVEVLKDFARRDWQLGSMVCQTLWNYSSRITSSNAFFGVAETQELQDLLTEYLGIQLIYLLPSQGCASLMATTAGHKLIRVFIRSQRI